ncbi:MAG: carboxypeptidase regulatory-like domain-containing protein [Isosphaeraceae bacterium]
MLTRSRTNRPSALFATLVGGLFAFPLVVAIAVDPEQASKTAPKDQQAAAAQPAILRGRVTDEAGAPLADARVRIAIPAADMRFVDVSTNHKKLEARSDANGDYRLEIPGIAKPTMISLDAMKPGYRRLVGTMSSGGDARRVEVAPGITAEASLMLRPALYFAGVVADERGKPISAVQITANLAFGRGYAGVERIASNLDGSFEIFCYPAKPPALAGGATKGVVYFSHPDYIDTKIDDVYEIPAEGCTALRVVLETGYRMAGTVFDVAGKPVPNALIKAVRKDGTHRKATMTDANGKFALRGLSPGLTLFSARALDIRQKIHIPMALKSDQTDLEVRLKAISLPAGLKPQTVLGMQLADVTPELKSAYDLSDERGALILDPGKDSDRLKIGQLVEGYVFWRVGRKRVGSVREFMDQLLAETAGQNAEEYSVRVVYSFSSVDFEGTHAQFLRLTKDDLKQLKIVSDQLVPELE